MIVVSHRLLSSLLLIGLLSVEGYTQSPEKQQLCECAPASARIAVRHDESNGFDYNQNYSKLEAFFFPSKHFRDRLFGYFKPARTQQKIQQLCGCAPAPARLAIRHIESKGIGYNQGYSTLEAFFSPYEPLHDRWFPFVDFRGHVFNNARLAANAGIGCRYLSLSNVWGPRIWGANVYYDYRNTKHATYHQTALGLESLGETWDFRLNGYLPFGSKKSSFYDLQFDHFAGHSMFQSRRREFAMKGANLEIGAHVRPYEWLPLYLAAGPYYLRGGNSAWGGEARAAFDCCDYVRLEAFVSYDNVFKWTGQGQLSLIFPFRTATGSQTSRQLLLLQDEASQRKSRSEGGPQ